MSAVTNNLTSSQSSSSGVPFDQTTMSSSSCSNATNRDNLLPKPLQSDQISSRKLEGLGTQIQGIPYTNEANRLIEQDPFIHPLEIVARLPAKGLQFIEEMVKSNPGVPNIKEIADILRTYYLELKKNIWKEAPPREDFVTSMKPYLTNQKQLFPILESTMSNIAEKHGWWVIKSTWPTFKSDLVD